MSKKTIIIGAGIVGCALADELTQRGWNDVTVLEQGPLWAAGGSTSHAPGLVFQTNASKSLALYAKYTVEKLCSLNLDGQPCFLQVGSLEVATNKKRLADLHRRASLANAWGINAKVISAKEAVKLHPLLNAKSILGALHVPTDGLAKAVRADEAMGRLAISRGAKFLERHEVIDILKSEGKVTGVRTNKGDFEAVKQLQEKQQQLELQRQDLINNLPPVEFKNITKPTWYELHDHLYGARNIGEAFDRIIKTDKLGSEGQRALIKALNKSSFIRDAELRLTKESLNWDRKEVAGLYHGGTSHKIEVGKEGDLQTLLHEAIHAGTQRLIAEGKSAAAVKLKELYTEFSNKHSVEYEAKLEQFKRDNPNASLIELQLFKEKNARKLFKGDVNTYYNSWRMEVMSEPGSAEKIENSVKKILFKEFSVYIFLPSKSYPIILNEK